MRKTHFHIVPAVTLAAAALAAPAQAQLSRSASLLAYSADERSSYYDARRAAYDNGYREGLKEGEKDARRGDRFEFRDEGAFRDGDKGYRRQFGDRERYRQTFRSGFAAGYSDAYQRLNVRHDRGRWERDGWYRGNTGYGGYGSRYGYSPALENGARDGYEKGIEDARKNRSFDPVRHKWYRDAERHYRGEYGSRERYRDVYRRGFQQGYERGYREARWRY
jgi:flagellar biosynthesis/type III secretory pathway protein FliH